MEQLLTTKLFVPKSRPDLVSRPHLIGQLNEGLQRKLTLVSAPAGFGKTTLISEWITNAARPAAWLSLEKGDGNTTRFLTYLIAALQTLASKRVEGVAQKFGEDIVRVLQTAQPPPIETILTALINEIANTSDEFILVLDDYHVLDAKPVDDALTFLLEHQPPQMHLVITTREDPNLPLARFRARGELTEIRVADLRFSLAEAAEFLNHVMDLALSEKDIAALETRTEGWIAGLQLAALSLRGRDDASGFIDVFAGDHRYIVDYLVEEVLQRQTKDVRNFLLQTSILGQLSGPLCDAVTGQGNSNELLEELGQRNLFVIPLDDKRYWFRYHHLFSDVLQANLMAEQPDLVPDLHQRASEWYEQNDSKIDAIRHALAGKDFTRTAELVELAWSEMDSNRQSAAWLGWVQALPDEVVRERPVLSTGYAWALLDQGELEDAETRLRDAERWLDNTAGMGAEERAQSIEISVADREEFQHLSATIATARAYLALALDDVPGTIKYARKALELYPEQNYLRRGTPAALLSLASWTSGDLKTAEKALIDAMRDYQLAGNILFAITGTFVLASIRTTLGRLRQAYDAYQESLRLAEGQGKFVIWGTADLYTGLSELLCEQNQLEAALEHLSRSRDLGEQSSLPRWRFRWGLAQARLKQAQGDLDGALNLLEEAERSYVRGPVPDIRPIPALKARVFAARGRLSEALDLVREQGVSHDDHLSYRREFEHITLARLLIARYKREQEDLIISRAMDLLDRLLIAAEEGCRMGSVIEILVLQALAYEVQGNLSSALAPLERALRLAEPEGYIRIFIDEGPPMAHLLSEAVAREVLPEYTARLLTAIGTEGKGGNDKSNLSLAQSLIEPLSEREVEILQLIARGLSNREISERLFLAVPTIKGHNRNIFGKLQVKRRTEAVARARELDLI